MVDGVNVKDYSLEYLHNKLGYVPQKAVMFNGTVTSNIEYGDNGKQKPTMEQVKKAIEVAQGTEFVEKMDNSYNAHIAQGGTNISGYCFKKRTKKLYKRCNKFNCCTKNWNNYECRQNYCIR